MFDSIFFAGGGKVIEAILKPLEWLLLKIIGPGLEKLAEVIGPILLKIIDTVIMPLIDIIVSLLVKVIDAVIWPLLEIFLMFYNIFFSMFLMIVLRVVGHFVGLLLAGILKMALLPKTFLSDHPFLEAASNTMVTLSWSLLLLIATYFAFKSMFRYFGFESEAPGVIMVRVGVAGLLVVSSYEICTYFFSFYYIIADVIALAFSGVSNLRNFSSSDNTLGSALDALPAVIDKTMFQELNYVALLLDTLIFVVMTKKLFVLAFKFAERQVVLMIYIIMGPVVSAFSVGKSTRDYFTMWCKTFAGNFVIQMIQLTGIFIMIAIIKASDGVKYDLDIFGANMLRNFLLLGCISAINGASQISVAIGGMNFGNDFNAAGFEAAAGSAKQVAVMAQKAASSAAAIK